MKKLLHIGCNAGTESMPKFFREQCIYSEMGLNSELAYNLDNYDETPDVVFLQIQSETIAGRDTIEFIGERIKRLKDAGAHVINWTGDLRNHAPNWMIRFAENVSVTKFSNYRDVAYFESINLPTGFLQQGIDTDIFTPEGGAADVPEIVFLANNYVSQFPLSSMRTKAVRQLSNYFHDRFKVYGNGWGAGSGNVNSSQYEEAKVYRGCKVAISISHYDVDGYFSDRLGRALCSGAFVLSHNYKGIERDFEVGTHLDTFTDLNHMVKQCERYLEDNESRERIAKAGCKLARKEFSYREIVRQILK